MQLKRLIFLMLCIISLATLTGCRFTAEQQAEYDPEKAALARLKLGLGYLNQPDETGENIKLAHYNLTLANQYSPNNPNVMLGMALFDQHVGEYQEADMIYNQIIKIQPNNMLYLNHYGSFLCATQKYDEAKIQFKKAISLNRPQWKADSLEQLGYCAIQHGDEQQADEAFSMLFQYDSTKRAKVSNIAKLYQHKGDEQIANYLLNISRK